MSTVDLSPVLNPMIQIGGLVLTGVATWAAGRVARLAHVNAQSQALNTLVGAVDRAIAYGQAKAITTVDANDKVAVTNATVAAAIDYVVAKLPGTLKTVGIDTTTAAGRQHVADLITARLPQ